MDIAERVADAVPEDATAGRWGRLRPQVLKVLQPLEAMTSPRTASLTYEPWAPEKGDVRTDGVMLRIPTRHRADSNEAEVLEHMGDLVLYIYFYWERYIDVSLQFAGDEWFFDVDDESTLDADVTLIAKYLQRIVAGELGPLYPRGSFERSSIRSAFGCPESLVVNAGGSDFRAFFRLVAQPRLRRFYGAGARWCHVVAVHETELEVSVVDVPCSALEFQQFDDWEIALELQRS
ncbi:hypothetical protein [Brevibacterium otitidis]|uniref:Uncharacterized protein n=1 Tax=Brevibacterium otitidis TaxID=53364 RepID=A0ABV5WZB2_9MICO|nr:hypothetical protein GCM10023233_02070 [Brevibacterium otitidis]